MDALGVRPFVAPGIIMLRPSLSACSVLALGALLPLAAADVEFVDIRAGAGLLSHNYTGASSTTLVSGNSNVAILNNSGESGRDADRNYRGQVQLVWGNLGPAGGIIVGGGVAMNQAHFDNGAQDGDVTIPVVDVLVGYGYAFVPQWHAELTPFAGIGRASYSVHDHSSTVTSDVSSKYIEYGAKLGTYYTFTEHLQVGIEIPYLIGRFDPEYNHNNGTDSYSIDDSRTNQGFGLLVTVGGRF